MCINLTAHSDYLVESSEEFTVHLTIVTPSGFSFHLGNTEMTIILIDTDGLLMYIFVVLLVG